MFAQGKKPTLLVPLAELERFRMTLRRAGYYPHTGHRYQRDGEIQAWTAELPESRHIHVQEVGWTRGHVAVFAHTEPAHGLLHAFSALTDRANYAAGSRKLRHDLKANGWLSPRVSGHRPGRTRRASPR
jgi:hypothetical protein